MIGIEDCGNLISEVKDMKKIFIAILLTVVCIAFAGCGGGSGYAKGEQF